MIYLLILIYMILLPGTLLVMLYKILNKLEMIEEKQTQINTTKSKSVLSRRKHTNIGKNDYLKSFSNREAYSDYKTNKGLYEPVTPHKGVKIEKEV